MIVRLRVPALVWAGLVAASLAACSDSPPNNTTPPVDSGMTPTDVFFGPGSLELGWTLNGQPASERCAAVGGVNVLLRIGINAPVTVPCATGVYRDPAIQAGLYNISAEVQDASGGVVLQHILPVTVQPSQMVNAVIPFDTPGTLLVTWTINGMPARDACAMVGGYGVELTAGLGVPVQVSFGAPARVACTNGRYTFRNVQAGAFTLESLLFSRSEVLNRLPAQTAEVAAGETSTVALEFSARNIM